MQTYLSAETARDTHTDDSAKRGDLDRMASRRSHLADKWSNAYKVSKLPGSKVIAALVLLVVAVVSLNALSIEGVKADGFWTVYIGVVIATYLNLFVARRVRKRKGFMWLRIITGIIFLFVLVPPAQWEIAAGNPMTVLKYTVPLASGVVAIYLFSSWRGDRKRTGRLRDFGVTNPYSPDQKVVFGTAGLVGQNSAFSKGRASAGAQGEALTARMLEEVLSDVPGIRIYHGVRFPGSHNADVDHALVLGKNLLLIDSKMFQQGSYSWSAERKQDKKRLTWDDVSVINGPSGRMENHMIHACNGYRDMAPSETKVDALVLIHSRNGLVEVSGTTDYYKSTVRMTNAQVGLHHIIRWASLHAEEPYSLELNEVMKKNLKGA